MEGNIFHQKAHDASRRERRGDILILRDLPVWSGALGISGKCDVVEFYQTKQGVSLHGEEGWWMPFPVEYKRGAQKSHQADELQLCAQAMCLEEMLCCTIEEGALFYGETRRRTSVPFTPDLRSKVQSIAEEMHMLYRRGYTPKTKTGKFCKSCSLEDLCVPRLCKDVSAAAYVKTHVEDDSL